MGQLIIGNSTIPFGDIRSGKWPEQPAYFHASLLFCHAWLNGEENFELETSGSTGKPKTILVHRDQMTTSAKATRDFFGIKTGQNLLCCLNTSMIGGKMMLVRALEWNSEVHLVEPSSNPFLDFHSSEAFDFTALVPLQLEAAIENEATHRILNRVENIIVGGAPISSTLREKAARLVSSVYQTYGMTETVSHIALANLKASGPLVYKALPGVRLYQSHANRLGIVAPMANVPSFLTNDLVEMKGEDGFIWKGRADFTINTGGIKVQPEVIEQQIAAAIQRYFPGSRFFVSGKPNEKLGAMVVLIMEGVKGENKRSEDLLSELKESLPTHHNPREIHFTPSFFETPSGKINRKETMGRLFDH